MGGNLPLGYDVEDRKLVINEREAAIVRQLFDLYIELRTVRLLKAEVDRLGIVTKQNIRKDGSVAGGKPLLRGNLYRLLSNPLYIGMILHKGETNPGMHKAVVDQEVWGQVQQIMSSNRRERSSPTNVTVIRPVWALLQDQQRLMDLLDFANPAPSLLQRLNVEADELAGKLIDENTGHQQAILQAIVQRVGLSADAITIDLSRKALASLLTMEENVASNEHDNIIPLRLAIKLQRKGVEAKLVIAGQSSGRHPDPDLCRLIAKAKNWFDQLASGDAGSVKEIAEREKVFDTEITRVLPLAFLAPSIIEDILNGRQPETLNVKSLKRISPLPMDWNEQQKRLGFHQ
ncbi:recombinase family protein [Sneathiella sp.]|uniref:recombinase family protein n=1 Tax=Sneathiella sp. TaxID=1964365 RepID=UPI003561D493